MGTKAACSIDLPDQPMDCCISSTDHLLASGLVSGQLVLHRYAATGEQQQKQQRSNCEHDQEAAAETSYTATQVFCRDSKKGASCRAVAFAADGAHIAAGFATGSILQVDAATGKVAARLTKAHAAGINRLLGIPQQPSLFACGDEEGGLCIWDMRSQSTALKYSKHTDFITGLTVHEKQQALLAVSGDGTLSVHDLRSSTALARSEDDADDELLSVAVVKNGKKVVCGSQSGVLAIWSWGYWNDCSDRFPGHPESVDAIVTYDEDTIITGSSDGALRVINILPNKLIGVVGEHEDDMPVERLALAHDRQVLASMSHDNCIKLWDLSILQDEEGGEEHEDVEEAAAAPTENELAGTSHTAAAAAASGRRRPRSAAGSDGSASDGDGSDSDDGGAAGEDSSSDDEKSSSKKKRKKQQEKTAMTKGRSKPSKADNFFADLL